MRNALLLSMLLLLSMAMVFNAAYVSVVNPYNSTVENNGTIYLGNVGPGQPFTITISSQTTNSTGFMLNYGWNQLQLSGLPSGWVGENSSLNNQFLSAQIKVAPLASDGLYSFNAIAINTGNYSRIGALKFRVFVNVTPKVFSMHIVPSIIKAGPGQPAKIEVYINNTGVSDSPFIINATGLPAWSIQSTVIALHHTTGRFDYPIYEYEPGLYHVRLNVSSSSSPLIHQEDNITFIVKASLNNDYSAIGNGAVAFPIIYAPAYAIMDILHEIARAIF